MGMNYISIERDGGLYWLVRADQIATAERSEDSVFVRLINGESFFIQREPDETLRRIKAAWDRPLNLMMSAGGGE